MTDTITNDPSTGTLPDGWRDVTIGEVAEGGLFTDGDWVESKDQDPAGGVRLTQLADVGEGVFRDRSDRWLRDDQAERLGVTYLSPGDLLIARMPDPLGRCCAVPALDAPAVTVVDVAVLRIMNEDALPAYVMWCLNSPGLRSNMVAVASGTTRLRVSRKNLAAILLPLPPLAEQTKIVEVLEEQLSRLDAALAAADLIEKRSAALRRSLLHAAFTGRLTEQWREQHRV
jgi:type I restriction enzyme S subunit